MILIQKKGYRIQDTEHTIQIQKKRIQDTGYRTHDTDTEKRIQDTGYRTHDRYRKKDTGYRYRKKDTEHTIQIQKKGYIIIFMFICLF